MNKYLANIIIVNFSFKISPRILNLVKNWCTYLCKEFSGLPWGFLGQPAPLPVETHTLVQGCGFPRGLAKPPGLQTHHGLTSHITMTSCHSGFSSTTTTTVAPHHHFQLPPNEQVTQHVQQSPTTVRIEGKGREKTMQGLKMSGVFFLKSLFLFTTGHNHPQKPIHDNQKAAIMRMGPNDARRVVWAISECFFFFSHFFTTNY